MAGESDLRGIAERLAAIGPRRAGSDAERRAAGYLADEIRAAGGKPRIEATYVHPQWPQILLLHCVLAIGGSLLATSLPIAGFAIVLITALSLYLDLAGSAYVLRRLFFRRSSQNVVAPPLPPEPRRGEESDASPERLLICAGYDSGMTGALWNRGPVSAFARLQSLWPAPLSPQAIVFWSVALLLPALGLRLAGIEDTWVAAIQLPQTLVLIVASFLLAEVALSPVSPAANAAAAAPAAAIEAWRQLRADPPEGIEIHLALLGGASSTSQGARELLRAHGRGLPKGRTSAIVITTPGRGSARAVRREVPVLTQPLGPELVELAGLLTPQDPLDPGPASPAALLTAAGRPAVTVTARDADEWLPSTHGTPADTIGEIDFDSVGACAELTVNLVRLLARDRARSGGA